MGSASQTSDAGERYLLADLDAPELPSEAAVMRQRPRKLPGGSPPSGHLRRLKAFFRAGADLAALAEPMLEFMKRDKETTAQYKGGMRI